MINTKLELNAISMLMNSRNPELLHKFSIDYFASKDLAGMFRVIQICYATHGEIIGWDGLVSEIVTRVKDGDQAEVLTDLVEVMRTRDISGLSEDSVRSDLIDASMLREALSGAQDLGNAIQGKDIDAVKSAIMNLYAKVSASSSDYDAIASSDLISMAGSKREYEFMETGYKGIDRRGGLIKSGLTLIAGEAKAGKSLKAQGMQMHMFKKYGIDAAYFTFEQSKEELLNRALSAESGVDIGKVMADNLNHSERKAVRNAHAKLAYNYNDDMFDMINIAEDMDDTEFWELFKDTFSTHEKANKLYLIDTSPNWDDLFLTMDLLHKTKGVTVFVIDYPYLVSRGNKHSNIASWEYNLLMIQELKAFCRRTGCRIIAPMQYSSETGTMRFVSNAINAADLVIAMSVEEGDDEVGDMGSITLTFKAYRNFKSIDGEPTLMPFKLLKEFNKARFNNLEFDFRDEEPM
jgi:hypothetical protein